MNVRAKFLKEGARANPGGKILWTSGTDKVARHCGVFRYRARAPVGEHHFGHYAIGIKVIRDGLAHAQ
jgi:hypothetical protein